ncbi:MAG: hypothetical protein GY906_37195 [bacterium]|nr:hypothetical protein [bacterium]
MTEQDDELQWWLMPMVIGAVSVFGGFRFAILLHIYISLKYGWPIL